MTRAGHTFVPALAALAACFFAAGTGPASANFSVCNKTAHPAAVALGFYDGAEWASSGWWRIAPGDCSILIGAPLISRYYYVYAEHQDIGGAWNGDRSFCVGKESFSIRGRADCMAKGFEPRRFFQVDTGNSTRWVENLAD